MSLVLRRGVRAVAATLFVLVVAACGGGGSDDSGAIAPPAGSVGAEGGTVTSADGKATLVIPAGALGSAIQFSIRPAVSSDGYVDDPQIVPGTAYKLDGPTVALAAPATFDIAVPAGATALSAGRVNARSVIPSQGFLGCYLYSAAPQLYIPVGTGVAGHEVQPLDGQVCVFDEVTFAFNHLISMCPAGFNLQQIVGQFYAPDYFTADNPHTVFHVGDFGPEFGYGAVVICTVRPDPMPIVGTVLGTVTLLPDKPGHISLLNPNIYAILVDKTPPVVQFTTNTSVIPTGNGMAKVHLEATASDDKLLKRVELSEETVVTGNLTLGKPFTVIKAVLGSFNSPPYVWESAPMPVDQIYIGSHYFYAKAFDAAGNQATASKTYDAATPLITSFTATPSTLDYGGGDVTLNWTTPTAASPAYSDSLSIDHGVGDVTGSISKVVHVTSSTTFTLTGINPAGPGSATASVMVGAQGAPIISAFVANPTSVPWDGGDVDLSWTTSGATSISITPGPGDVTAIQTHHVPVHVTTDSTFTLTASNTNPAPATATAHVTLLPKPAPTITSFTSDPATLGPGGGPVTLHWTTTLADTLSIAPTIGAVTGTSHAVPNVAATTTFVLTATNATGPVMASLTVPVASSGDRFVDPAAGSDANACSQAAPCRTIVKGLAGAQGNSTVWLLAGAYDQASQQGNPGTDAVIPDGVTLKSVTPGGALIEYNRLVVSGSAVVNGVVLDFGGSLSATSATGTPTLAMIGVFIKQQDAVSIGGMVKATMVPGSLPGGLYTLSTPMNGSIVLLTGSAELIVQGGIFDGDPMVPSSFGMLSASNTSKLTLDGATVRNRVVGDAIRLNDTASFAMKNGALLDNVATGVSTNGSTTISIDGSTISHYVYAGILDAGGIGLQTISVKNSLIGHGLNPDTMQTFSFRSAAYVTSDANVTLDGATLTDNTGGMYWVGRTSATHFDVKNSTVTGNRYQGGLWLLGTGSMKVRSSMLSNNGYAGIRVSDSAVADIGTQASPGLNTLVNNVVASSGMVGPQIASDVAAGGVTQAAGNTWMPNIQGADANGHYSTAPTYVPVPKTGPASINAPMNFEMSFASMLNL